MNKKEILAAALFFAAVAVFGWDVSFFRSSFANIPEGWYVALDSEDTVTFSDPTNTAFFQVKRFPGSYFGSAEEIFRYVLKELNAEGEGEGFLLNSKESYFASLSFAKGSYVYSGYMTAVENEVEDTVLLSFCDAEVSDIYQDFLLSVLDSYSSDEAGRKRPGPVSQFYYPSPGPDKTLRQINVGGNTVPVPYDENEVEAAQVLVEREARVLVQYSESDLSDAAWVRYYRMIYRDNFSRMGRVSLKLEDMLAENFNELTDLEKSRLILAWIQGFEYIRTGTLSDFMSPIDSVLNMAGDCDSRAMLYVMILEYCGIDAILMVSSEYSHSIAGVLVEGTGAHFSYQGKNYLVAETTDSVSIGLIDRDMADPAKWMGIDF